MITLPHLSTSTFNDENQTSIGTVQATDADGDSVLFHIEGDASSMSINSITGVLSSTQHLTMKRKVLYNNCYGK